MGEAPATTWSDELRRTGQVVFTYRPRRLLAEVLQFWVIYAFIRWLSSSGRWGEDDRAWFVALVLAICVGFTGWYGWLLGTRRPVVTVSQQGIRVGRRFLSWGEVGAIGIPHGFKPNRTLPVIPRDVYGKNLHISQMTVRDIPALAAWLEEELRAQRASR
jgi:hypothetical protein